MARQGPETGCVVRRTNGPPAGARAHRAGEVRRAAQAPHGVEQNVAVLQDPVMVNRLFLKTPERREALGFI